MSPYSFTQAGTTYDAEDRLTGFARAATSGTPQLSQSWNLSAVGDWNSVTTNGTAQSRTHGPTHELVTAGGQSVTHDTKGNMLLIPASVRANSSPLVLTWDFDNRMVSADVGADSVIDVTHQYDALGRRVARTASGSTTVFVQVDQQTICDYASGAAPASSTYRYLYGSYIDEPIVRIATSNSETTWYHRNQQYSIVACTDSSGAATERYAYTAYGLPTITDGSGTVRTSSAIGNRYMYTGREWDGVLGLYHYRARMYEATVGRFCSRDPIGYVGGHESLYGLFIRLIAVDPSGQIVIEPHLSIDLNKVLYPCKKDSKQAWTFRLSKKASELCNGKGGVIVQKITSTCSGSRCKDREQCDPKAEPNTVVYYEAWLVGPNSDVPSGKFENKKRVTDNSIIPVMGKACGKFRTEGVVRFYCSDITEEQLLQHPPLPFKKTCIGNEIQSGDLPAWEDEKVEGVFDWKSSGDDGEATRWHQRDFECCDCAPIIDKADANPKKELTL